MIKFDICPAAESMILFMQMLSSKYSPYWHIAYITKPQFTERQFMTIYDIAQSQVVPSRSQEASTSPVVSQYKNIEGTVERLQAAPSIST